MMGRDPIQGTAVKKKEEEKKEKPPVAVKRESLFSSLKDFCDIYFLEIFRGDSLNYDKDLEATLVNMLKDPESLLHGRIEKKYKELLSKNHDLIYVEIRKILQDKSLPVEEKNEKIRKLRIIKLYRPLYYKIIEMLIERAYKPKKEKRMTDSELDEKINKLNKAVSYLPRPTTEVSLLDAQKYYEEAQKLSESYPEYEESICKIIVKLENYLSDLSEAVKEIDKIDTLEGLSKKIEEICDAIESSPNNDKGLILLRKCEEKLKKMKGEKKEIEERIADTWRFVHPS